MKYFTPQLWLQTQAGVDGPTFSAAYEDWERAVDAYEKSLEQTIPNARDLRDRQTLSFDHSQRSPPLRRRWPLFQERMQRRIMPPDPMLVREPLEPP
jgi:hypothetical protein